MSDQPDLRIGDLERDDATGLLQEHLAAGRLDSAEFDARMTRALGATHRSHLDALFADLPGRRPGQAVMVTSTAPPPARGVPLWVWPVGAAAALWFGGLGMMSAGRAVMGGPPGHVPMMEHGAHAGAAGFIAVPLLLFTVAVVAAVAHAFLRRHGRRHG